MACSSKVEWSEAACSRRRRLQDHISSRPAPRPVWSCNLLGRPRGWVGISTAACERCNWQRCSTRRRRKPRTATRGIFESLVVVRGVGEGVVVGECMRIWWQSGPWDAMRHMHVGGTGAWSRVFFLSSRWLLWGVLVLVLVSYSTLSMCYVCVCVRPPSAPPRMQPCSFTCVLCADCKARNQGWEL